MVRIMIFRTVMYQVIILLIIVLFTIFVFKSAMKGKWILGRGYRMAQRVELGADWGNNYLFTIEHMFAIMVLHSSMGRG